MNFTKIYQNFSRSIADRDRLYADRGAAHQVRLLLKARPEAVIENEKFVW